MDRSFGIWLEWSNRTQIIRSENESDKQKIKDSVNSTFYSFFRFSCAAVVRIDRDRSKFEHYGNPRVWDSNFIRTKIKGNSTLYLLEVIAFTTPVSKRFLLTVGILDFKLDYLTWLHYFTYYFGTYYFRTSLFVWHVSLV